MDASLHVAIERLYSQLTKHLAAIDSMHRVRLGPPASCCGTLEGIRESFWTMFDSCGKSFDWLMNELSSAYQDAKTTTEDKAVSRVVFQTISRQSLAFKPAKATTFCGEAIERIHSLMLFYHRLLNRMQATDRSDSEMSRIYRDCELLWDEFGFSQGDFDELQRGLLWEFATVCDMQGWNSNGGKPQSKTGSKKDAKTPRKRGRNPVKKIAKTDEEKRIWHQHKELGRSAAVIADDLRWDDWTEKDFQRVINRLLKRQERIETRKKPDTLTDS